MFPDNSSLTFTRQEVRVGEIAATCLWVFSAAVFFVLVA
jgi:hypothetical protein